MKTFGDPTRESCADVTVRISFPELCRVAGTHTRAGIGPCAQMGIPVVSQCDPAAEACLMHQKGSTGSGPGKLPTIGGPPALLQFLTNEPSMT